MTNLTPLFNHLWQSTIFAAVAALLALALRRNHARVRYWLWLAASLKFLAPFSALVFIGRQMALRTVHGSTGTPFEIFFGGVSHPFVEREIRVYIHPVSGGGFSLGPQLLALVWLCGFLVVVCRWLLRWRRIDNIVCQSVNITTGTELEILRHLEQRNGARRPLPMRSSPAHLEPGIFGILRPVLLWPDGISQHLSRAQIEAVIAHELCHVRRRDNLAAALHMAVEALFWFHPLVWWLGARLVDERENACDEEVLRLGGEPAVYAESILKTCQFYLESPLTCIAGVTGSDLKKRIERIMTHHFSNKLDFARKLLLASAAIAAVALPIGFGLLNGPQARAQSKPESAPKAFEVASIKLNNSGDHRAMFGLEPGGRLQVTNMPIKQLIMMAYRLKDPQISGGPGWLDSERYDIVAKPEGSPTPDELREMVQTLLADRFKLAFHRESKEESIYALVAAKNGPKLQASAGGGEHQTQMRMGRGQLNAESVSLAQFADVLSNIVGRNVTDRTGLKGNFNIKLEWTPDENQSGMLKGLGEPKEGSDGAPSTDSSGPSIFTALQEQLGLKLEAQKGPVEILIIDHVEKPSEN